MKKHLFLITFLFLLPITILAHGDHGGMGVVSEEYLESPIAVLKGVGTYADLEMVSSLPPGPNRDLAETYTKQGLALHHAFQWEDSVRSYKEALRLDPDMARAHLGLVTSYLNLAGGNDSLSFVTDLLKHAADSALKVQNNELDRLWIDTMTVFYQAQYNITVSNTPISVLGKTLANANVNQKLSGLVGEMIQTYKDPEAYAFLGWDLQSYNYLEEGVRSFPKHSGILHYLTHYHENSGRYQIAADHALNLIGETPDAPHLLHMYGHVLPLLGRWEEANVYFLKAHCIHKAVLRQQDSLCEGQTFEAPMSSMTPKATEFWHFAHNLDLYGFSLTRTRDLVNAENIFRQRCEVGDCSFLVQFYLGEKMYDKAINFIDTDPLALAAPNAYVGLKVQALLGQERINEAYALFQQKGGGSGIEGFATQLALAWSLATPLNPAQTSTLQNWLSQATASPNFDTWSHTLPVLRKLYKLAEQYEAAEQQILADAINKIDKGHPL